MVGVLEEDLSGALPFLFGASAIQPDYSLGDVSAYFGEHLHGLQVLFVAAHWIIGRIEYYGRIY